MCALNNTEFYVDEFKRMRMLQKKCCAKKRLNRLAAINELESVKLMINLIWWTQ